MPLRAIIPAGAYLAVIVLACLALTARAPAEMFAAGVLLGIVTLAQTTFALATGFRHLTDPIPRINLLVLIAISCLAHALLVLMLVACWFFFLLPAPDVSFYPRDRNVAITMILLVLAVRAPGFWLEYRRMPRFVAARGIINETFRATIGFSVLSGLLLGTAHPWPSLLVAVATIILAVSLTCVGLSALLALLRPRYEHELREKHAGILHCRKCNYELRASADRCPECGTPIPKT